MKRSPGGARPSWFDRLALAAVRASGTSSAFGLASLIVVGWAAAGPWFDYSETWQLVINTGTTIVTFLMVFLIQHSQNKDNAALHLKLNELLASHRGASNRLIASEGLDDATLDQLKKHYARLAELASEAEDVMSSHSLEQAARRHHGKRSTGGDNP